MVETLIGTQIPLDAATIANWVTQNRINAKQIGGQQRSQRADTKLRALELLASRSGPQDWVAYNYLNNRMGTPTGQAVDPTTFANDIVDPSFEINARGNDIVGLTGSDGYELVNAGANAKGDNSGVPGALLQRGLNYAELSGDRVWEPNYAPAYWDQFKTRPIKPGDFVPGGSKIWIDYQPQTPQGYRDGSKNGFVNDRMYMVGEPARGKLGRTGEVVFNPTGAPNMVLNNEQARAMLKGMMKGGRGGGMHRMPDGSMMADSAMGGMKGYHDGTSYYSAEPGDPFKDIPSGYSWEDWDNYMGGNHNVPYFEGRIPDRNAPISGPIDPGSRNPWLPPGLIGRMPGETPRPWQPWPKPYPGGPIPMPIGGIGEYPYGGDSRARPLPDTGTIRLDPREWGEGSWGGPIDPGSRNPWWPVQPSPKPGNPYPGMPPRRAPYMPIGGFDDWPIQGGPIDPGSRNPWWPGGDWNYKQPYPGPISPPYQKPTPTGPQRYIYNPETGLWDRNPEVPYDPILEGPQAFGAQPTYGMQPTNTYTQYDPNVLRNLPFYRKLIGELPSTQWTGFGATLSNPELGIYGAPSQVNLQRFLKMAPTEQKMTQSLYEQGLAMDFGDMLEKARRGAPFGQSFGLARYGT